MSFKELFNAQKFTKASKAFDALSQQEKEKTLKELYYAAREAAMPAGISVIRRTLNENKTLDDFTKAWMPPKDKINPIQIGDKTYYQYFQAPIRVLNAVSLKDPNEIVSIGLVWCDEKDFIQAIQEEAQSKSNEQRHDNISDVAELTGLDVYLVRDDKQLGT